MANLIEDYVSPGSRDEIQESIEEIRLPVIDDDVGRYSR